LPTNNRMQIAGGSGELKSGFINLAVRGEQHLH